MWELDYKESWVPKNWCFWTVVLEKTLESPLDCKEIQPVHPKGKQSWIYWKDWCWSWNSNTLATWCEELTHWERPWCWERWKQEKATTEDEMAGRHHPLNGHESEQAPGVGGGQGSLVCGSPWDCKESDTTEWLNWISLMWKAFYQYLNVSNPAHVLIGFLTFLNVSIHLLAWAKS